LMCHNALMLVSDNIPIPINNTIVEGKLACYNQTVAVSVFVQSSKRFHQFCTIFFCMFASPMVRIRPLIIATLV
jgi:hypothetical protein